MKRKVRTIAAAGLAVITAALTGGVAASGATSSGQAAPAVRVPSLLCGLAGHNLLTDGSFETLGPAGPYTLTSTYSAGVGPGSSAAAGWETFNDTFEVPVATSTDRLPTTLPPSTCPGRWMIHVATWIGGRNVADGLFQEFGVHNQGPKYATFSVWVYVVQGSAGVGIGNEGATSITAVDDTPGRWVQLRGSNLPSQSPVNGMAIYGNSLGLDDFYVDLATVQAASGPSAG